MYIPGTGHSASVANRVQCHGTDMTLSLTFSGDVSNPVEFYLEWEVERPRWPHAKGRPFSDYTQAHLWAENNGKAKQGTIFLPRD